jgi:VanZ family protein
LHELNERGNVGNAEGSVARIHEGSRAAPDNNRGPRHWISAWWPVALGILIIAAESTPCFGADRTSGPFRWIFQALFGPVNDTRWEILHGVIRKSGHFLGYGAIGVAWLRAWRITWPRLWFVQGALLALFGTALMASADEWHQSYLPNRTGSPRDVLIDCCGVLTLQVLMGIFFALFRPRLLARVV